MNDLKPMKIRETELNRLKDIQKDISRELYGWQKRYDYSLSECVKFLLDLHDEIIRTGNEVTWMPQYREDSMMRIIIDPPEPKEEPSQIWTPTKDSEP